MDSDTKVAESLQSWINRAVNAEAKLKVISDYNDTLLHEDDCDARYDDEDNARCNCSKGHIESLLNRSKGQGD